MTTRIGRTRRNDEVVTKSVELSKLIEPKFLTLTGRPANQVAFKIVRDDSQKDTNMTTEAEQTRKRRVRATKRSALLSLEFPEGTTDEAIQSVATQYGLEGYEVVTEDEGKKLLLRRSDLTEMPAASVSVTLANGVVAKVARADSPAATVDQPLPAIAVVAIEFNKSIFPTEEAAMAVIQRYDIDFLDKGVENTDNAIRVVRTDVAEGTELRRVEVEEGVVAVIARAEVADMGTVAVAFVDVVSETAYGNWGWGHLDFASALADVEFCNAADEATYRFRNVIDNILYYSELPVSIRKDLVTKAAEQFSAYIASLIDGLPTSVVVINRSIQETKEHSMTKKTEATGAEGQAAQRADETQSQEPITRAEIATMISEAVTAAMAAAKPADAGTENVTRNDDTETTGETTEDSGDGKVLKAVESVTRSIETMASTLTGLASRVEKIEGATVVRSDADDNATAATEPKDVFAGMFSGKQS